MFYLLNTNVCKVLRVKHVYNPFSFSILIKD